MDRFLLMIDSQSERGSMIQEKHFVPNLGTTTTVVAPPMTPEVLQVTEEERDHLAAFVPETQAVIRP